jgi:two-component system sensor histidine kinase KdpD
MDPVIGATAASRGDRVGRTHSDEHVERVVVALRDGVGGELLLQRATALAGRGGSAELLCVHVVRADGSLGVLSDELVELRRLTAAAGTGLHTVLGEDVPEALLQFARDVGATQLVLGVDPGGALRPFRSGRVGAVVSAAAALDVHLVPVPALDRSRRSGRRRGPLSSRRRVLGWLAAVALPPIVSVIGVAAGDRADQCCSGVHVGRRRGGPDRGARCRWQHPLHGP